MHLPLDGIEDREFWDRWAGGPQFATPLYYGPFALGDVAADYELSAEGLPADQGREIDELLRREGTSVRELIVSMVASLDVEAHLRAGGLGDEELAAVRARLLDPASGATAGAARPG